MHEDFFSNVAVGSVIAGVVGLIATGGCALIGLYADHSAKILKALRLILYVCFGICIAGVALLIAQGLSVYYAFKVAS